MNQLDENQAGMLQTNFDCDDCGKNVVVKDAIKNRDVEEFKGYTEMGLECPHCNHWIHVSFSSPRLDVLRQQIKKLSGDIQSLSQKPMVSKQMIDNTVVAYRRARKSFSDEHKRVNRTMRKKFGRKSPSRLMAEKRKMEQEIVA